METIKINTTTLNFNKIYYVDSVLGNDSTGVGTLSSSFKTLTKAISFCVNNDAIFLKGATTESVYFNTLNITILGDYLKYGSKIIGSCSGNSSSYPTVTFYGLFIYGVGGSGWSEQFYYINATVNNCIYQDTSGYSCVYGVYRFNNCLILGMAAPWSGGTFTNCAFVGGSVGTTVTCLQYAQYNSDYQLINPLSSWLNRGTGTNPDGSAANIGLYGGQFSFGNMYSLKENNFQHYAIRLHNKYYILTEKYFDITKMEFTPVTLTDLYDFESEISDKQLDVKNIFNPINIQNKMIYPLDCFKSTSGMRIIKIVGISNTYTGMNNNKFTSITLESNFVNLYKSTFIKLIDVIKLKFNELKYFITINNSATLKVLIESDSILYGKNFEIVNEDNILANGFDAQDFNKLEIPFDNVRFIFAFKEICTNSKDELKYIEITKSNDYLKRPLLINKDYMSVIDKQTNNLYIKLLDNFPSIIVNRIENKDKILKTTNTIDAF